MSFLGFIDNNTEDIFTEEVRKKKEETLKRADSCDKKGCLFLFSPGFVVRDLYH